MVLRPEGWEALSDEAFETLGRWKSPTLVWRGMTQAEYRATIGARKPIWSTGSYSLEGEGTNFSTDPLDAEGYVNFGRDDPRKTHRPNYLVGVRRTPEMAQARDGYIKSPVPVDLSKVEVVWEMRGDDGVLVARKI